MHLTKGKFGVFNIIPESRKDVKQEPYPLVSLSGPFCSFPACQEQSGYIKTNSSSFYLQIII